jgi:phosphoribosylformylglycinamidine (FGAM) synthase-like amidotransferase family enzyme
VATKRHNSAVVTHSSNNKVSTFFKSIVPDKLDMAIALQEGTYAFHTVQHHQSFKSMDCSSGLIKKFFEPKFTCSRTKVETIIKHVISP